MSVKFAQEEPRTLFVDAETERERERERERGLLEKEYECQKLILCVDKMCVKSTF